MDSNVVPVSDDRAREFKAKKLRTALQVAGLDVPRGLGVQKLGYVLEEAGLDHDRYIVTSGLTDPKRKELEDAAGPMFNTLWKVAGAEYRTRKIVEQVQGGEAGAPKVLEYARDFAELPTSKFAARKARLKDELGSDLNLNDFKAAVRDAERQAKREEVEQGDRPTITISGRQSREVVKETKTALYRWNDPPTIFQRGTDPVHIDRDDQERPVIVELPDAALDSYIHDAANFIRESDDGVRQDDLPKRYVQRIRETVDLPSVKGITEVPVMRKDGSLLTQQGYDEASNLYFEPAPGLDVPDIPLNPTEEDVQRALDTLWKPLQDFPFVDQASKANALALMLTTVTRPVLQDQNVPLAAVDATVQGTGKTLFVTVVAIMSTGRPAATMSAPDSDEEWRKQITAQLLQGASMIVVDNVRGRLQSAPLEQALTTSTWQDRVLGQSKQVEIPQRATWVATGNNIQPKGDMLRRVYTIRMDAEMERPWMGREFQIDDLESWTKGHRGELVASALTLARSWFSGGCPEPSVEALGSFEQWTRTVGGILEHAGVEGFLDNLDDMMDKVDQESAEWSGFLEAVGNYFANQAERGKRDGRAFTAQELADAIQEAHAKEFPDDYLDDILRNLPGYVADKLSRGGHLQKTIGRMFGNRRGRRFGPEEHRIEVEFVRSRVKHWIVRSGSQAGVKSESGEFNEFGDNRDFGKHPHLDGKGGGGGIKNQAKTNSPNSDPQRKGFGDEPPF